MMNPGWVYFSSIISTVGLVVLIVLATAIASIRRNPKLMSLGYFIRQFGLLIFGIVMMRAVIFLTVSLLWKRAPRGLPGACSDGFVITASLAVMAYYYWKERRET